MIVLAVDTALEAASVAILEGDAPRFTATEPMSRGHQERLALLVRTALSASKIRPDEIDRLGVVVGPGSFTGVRVGLAFAKGFALARQIPCVGVSSLEALALSIGAEGYSAAIIAAGRGEVYLQLFDSGRPMAPPEALGLAEAERRMARAPRPLSLLGSGADPFRDLPGVRLDPRLFPCPGAVARKAMGVIVPIAPPAPLYLRRPDAKTLAERGRS